MTSIVHSGYISLFITNNATSVQCEKRYPYNITIGELKAKLELVTGCDHRFVSLQVFTEDDEPVCCLDDNMSCLGDYPIKDKMRLHATDPNLKGGEFEQVDESQPLYEISFEEYAKREDTVLAFKRRNKLGQFREVDPEEERLKNEAAEKKLKEEKDRAESITVGDRCEVRVPSQPTKRGLVKYIGLTHFKPGYWIGVQYDEPSGKNNGTVDGTVYFDCPEKYGAFVKPQFVAVGDYPELGLDDLDEI